MNGCWTCSVAWATLPCRWRAVREVVAVEGVQAMVERAAANAVSNNLHNASFFRPIYRSL
jgi:tRNA/tmRNA/rRNA uracil-C5-methylase (TrmA/RlmC/RlmD family)